MARSTFSKIDPNPLRRLLDLIYPPKCPFCGRVLEKGEDGLCVECQETLPWTEPGDGKDAEFCDSCLSPLWYQGRVPEGVRRFKFRGGSAHARLFGELMAQCLSDRQERPADLIVWVPLHPRRRRKRGYDQSELLARRVGELTGLPVVNRLKKVRRTEVQSQIQDAAARRANVSGAYTLAAGVELSGKRVVLVDDVVTSGATLSECAFLLRQAGAEAVTGLTLARAR